MELTLDIQQLQLLSQHRDPSSEYKLLCPLLQEHSRLQNQFADFVLFCHTKIEQLHKIIIKNNQLCQTNKQTILLCLSVIK